MLMKFKAPIRKVKKELKKIDLATHGVRLGGVSAIHGYTYVKIIPLASEGEVEDLDGAIQIAKAGSSIPTLPPDGGRIITNLFIDPVAEEIIYKYLE